METYYEFFEALILAPLGFLLLKFVNHSARISKIETIQETYVDKVDSIDKKLNTLSNDVSYMKGLLDEHFKKSQ